MVPLVERSVFNPKTGVLFAFPDHWSAAPIHYGHPLGLGISTDPDSNWTLNTLMRCYGAAIQDENANLTINSPATIEAVKVCAEIYRTGMTDEVFAWDASSNNRLLTSGRGSLVLNAISAVRAVEQQDSELASKVALSPVPIGSAGDRPRGTYLVGSYVIWRFSPNIELAKQFLVDLSLAYRDAFQQSGFYNLPAFPGAIPDLSALVAKDPTARPQDKYAVLADATRWSTNAGSPGPLNAAVDE